MLMIVLLLPSVGGAAHFQIIDDCDSIQAWSHNPDGGRQVELSLETSRIKSGRGAMRCRYSDAPPHWGNVQRKVSIPPDAVAVTFQLLLISAESQAAMHLWFIEPDGDGWVQQVLVGGKRVGELSADWHHVSVPIGGMQFSPRGNGQRQFLTCNKMLLGFNFGSIEVVVDDLSFQLANGGAPMPLPRTEGLKVSRTPKGSIAILQEQFPTELISKGAADAERLGVMLRQAGFGVTFLRAGDLCDGTVLSKTNFDLLVLPDATNYPVEGRDALIAYLRAGGSFLSFGGYAFDRPLRWTSDGWREVGQSMRAADLDSGRMTACLNSRFGKPGDTMGLDPDQISVFDPSYPLREVSSVTASPGQFIIPKLPVHETDKVGSHRSGVEALQLSLEGWAACAMIGSNSPVFPQVHARWIPLLTAFDRFGRSRGPVGALVHHYAGAFRGSSWAFFGVTSHDIVTGPPQHRLLSADNLSCLAEALVEKVLLHDLRTDFACYRPGEGVEVAFSISNFGQREVALRWEMAIAPAAQASSPAYSASGECSVAAGKPLEVVTRWEEPRFTSDLYAVRVTLLKGSRPIDQMMTGFVVWDRKTLRRWQPVSFRENYFHIGNRPQFLCGTNQTGMMWFSALENPLTWDRDFRTMAENGLTMLRILHFSPFSAGGYEGKPTNNPLDLKHRPEKLLRQTDAIVYLAQKHGVIIFLSLHDWMGVDLTDEQLEAQRGWNEFWARRYRDVPGIIYDVQNEPSVRSADTPTQRALFNAMLKERYGSDAALRAAWGDEAPKESLPDIPVTAASNAWGSVKAFDLNMLKVRLLNRWVEQNVAGIRAGNPKALATVGYLQSMEPADKILGVKHTDFSNMHYYGDTKTFARTFKITDRRAVGKGLSIGEFGAREAHDARVNGLDGTRDPESISRFLMQGHIALGLGAAFIANWDWKDFAECVFPWGLNHPSPQPIAPGSAADELIPKPVLHAYACQSLFFQPFRWKFRLPELFLLIPDSHRLGGWWNQVHEAVFRAADGLLDNNVDFAVINEFDIGHLPAGAKALLWPVPYCPTDQCFHAVVQFVKEGGVLYFSGDIGFDELRRPTRGDRWEALGLPRRIPRPPEAEINESADPLTTTIGRGKVFFVPRPIELSGSPLRDLYAEFLAFAHVKGIGIQPPRGPFRAFEQETEDGTRVVIVCPTGDTDFMVTVDLGVPIELVLRPNLPCAVAVSREGRIVAVEGTRVTVAGRPLLNSKEHTMVRSLDGRDIRSTTDLLTMTVKMDGTIPQYPHSSRKR